ncbi:hypothetical protein [Hydrogenophaga sp. PBC]|nr:hypothetical protein [Hydrogenophaga sp. PBC]
MTDLLPYLNLLLVPMVGLLLNIERRLTRLEALREADSERRRLGVHTVT